jgi:hypothetical protein
MGLTAAAALRHNDTRDYLRRVLNSSGSIARNVQLELNEFVKWHYGHGLRDVTGANHGVRYCSLFITNALAGYLQCLWHTTTQKTNTLTGTAPTYALTTGLSIDSDVSSLNTNFNTNNIGTVLNNFAIGVYATSYVAVTDTFADLSTQTSSLRFYAPWSDHTIYFDAGDESIARVNYTIPSGNRTKALYVGTKENTTQQIVISGSSVVSQTRNAVTFSATSNLIYSRNFVPNVVPRQVGGFFVSAKAIPSTLFSAHYTAWQRLQQAVSTSR